MFTRCARIRDVKMPGFFGGVQILTITPMGSLYRKSLRERQFGVFRGSQVACEDIFAHLYAK